jgi:crotonobetainyl-CoA:carnitine CoA-transferase CaiB-like acyl-CoA transferase
MSFTGETDDPPLRYPVALADLICGIYSFAGILAALFARETSGKGQFLDMTLFDSQLTLLANIGSNYLNAGVMPTKWGNAHPSIVPYQLFRGRDQRHFVIGVATEALWEKFTQFLGVEQTIGRDPLFQSNASRIRNRQALIPLLQELFLQRNANEWVVGLKDAQIPAAQIATVDEAFSNAQTIERGLIVELEHPLLNNVKSIANPIRMSGTPAIYLLPPPLLGEHTVEILSELNFSSEEIAAASLSGAV